MSKLESSLQTEFIKDLQALGYYTYKHPPYPTGVADIHAFKDGKHYWFEVKRSESYFRTNFKNKALQKLRRKHFREYGDVVCVVWLWEHVLSALNGDKIPKFRR